MIDIAILRAMVAAGAPVEAILAAIETDQRSEIARVQARRLADAERKRLSRMSHGQPVTPRDTADVTLSLTSSLTSSNTSENKQKEERKKVRGARGKHLLPDDWGPKPSHFAKAAAQGTSFVNRKADDMRDWAKSKAVMRADWDATFNGFLRRDGKTEHVNGRADVMDAIDNLIDRAGGEAVEPSAEIRDITPRGA